LISIEAFMDPQARVEASALQPKAYPHPALGAEPVAVSLNAAILAVRGDEPLVAVVPARAAGNGEGALPCGPFLPRQHDSIDAGLRFWVQQQTGVALGAIRQIGTLGEASRPAGGAEPPGLPIVIVCHLALVAPAQLNDDAGAAWRSWYAYLPWEDWRRGRPACLAADIEPRLKAWARVTPAHCEARVPQDAGDRSRRLRIAFGFDGAAWDEEQVLERYELLGEAGLVGEAAAGSDTGARAPGDWPSLRHPVLGDHAWVLAAAIAELRRSSGRTCTSRTSAGWSRAVGWSSRPGSTGSAPVAGPRSFSASAPTYCSSGWRPACASRPRGVEAEARRPVLVTGLGACRQPPARQTIGAHQILRARLILPQLKPLSSMGCTA
jgi:hypothetical protein